MSDNIVISIKDVSKDFKLPHEKADSVKSLFINPFNQERRKFEVQHALRHISFDIKEGEFFGVVGRNGSGKSTLLKIIAGIYQPNSGSVTVNGRLVPFIELGVGFNPELTGRENVYLNGALLGFSEKEVDRKYREIVDFSELERFMDQKLKNYSSGMQVRLAFSVATRLAELDILLIDEVLAVGDADFQRKCFEYFRKLKKDKKTVVFVSHDMSAIREYCDKAVLLNDNEVVFAGTSDQTAKEYTKLFLPDIYKAEQRELKESKKKDRKWGSGGVDISKVKMSKSIYEEDDKTINVSYVVTCDDNFNDEIVPGFTIKNEQGQPVCGTNSDILFEKSKKISINGGQEMFFEWSLPNIMNGGKYTIDPAILSGTNGDTLQWWDEAVSFRVINKKSTPYLVTPPISLDIK